MQVSFAKKRVLSVFALVMINVIAIDSLRNLPTNAANGLLVPFFYLLAGLLFLLPCALVTAELATHHPEEGGVYVWVREAFGLRVAFVAMWLQWIYNVFWYPTILAFIAVNIAYLIDPTLAQSKMFMLATAITLFVIASIANSFNMQVSGLISIFSAMVGTLLPMLCIIILGIAWIATGHPVALDTEWSHWLPSKLSDWHNSAYLVVVLFSLMGLEMSAVHAEEVKNPERDYPRALLISSLIIVITLTLASTAIALVIPANQLDIISGLDQALATFLHAFHLQSLMPLVLLMILIGGFGGMAAWVIGPTKGMMIAAQDGCLPQCLASHNRFNAPHGMLFLQCVLVVLLCSLFLYFPTINAAYWLLSDLTAQLALIFYVILFASALRLRYKTARKASAYRIPFANTGIWVAALTGIGACLFGIVVGFFLPDNIAIKSPLMFDLLLLGGIVIAILVPLLLYQGNKAIQK